MSVCLGHDGLRIHVQAGRSIRMQDQRKISAGEMQQTEQSRIKIMVSVAGIKGAFIYHLRFVALSILRHRDTEQRPERGRRTKKINTAFSVCSYGQVRVTRFARALAEGTGLTPGSGSPHRLRHAFSGTRVSSAREPGLGPDSCVRTRKTQF